MKTIDYEIPELVEARFGRFVRGISLPGAAPDNDEETEDIP